MTSVERVKEYTEIKPEDTTLATDLPKHWPADGRIVFKNLSFRHHESLPYVLHDISCSIDAGEKVFFFCNICKAVNYTVYNCTDNS